MRVAERVAGRVAACVADSLCGLYLSGKQCVVGRVVGRAVGRAVSRAVIGRRRRASLAAVSSVGHPPGENCGQPRRTSAAENCGRCRARRHPGQ